MAYFLPNVDFYLTSFLLFIIILNSKNSKIKSHINFGKFKKCVILAVDKRAQSNSPSRGIWHYSAYLPRSILKVCHSISTDPLVFFGFCSGSFHRNIKQKSPPKIGRDNCDIQISGRINEP